jgi:hypothetical protein
VAPTSTNVKSIIARVTTRMRENVIALLRVLQKYRCHADFFDVEDDASSIDTQKNSKILSARTPRKRRCCAFTELKKNFAQARLNRLSRAH